MRSIKTHTLYSARGRQGDYKGVETPMSTPKKLTSNCIKFSGYAGAHVKLV